MPQISACIGSTEFALASMAKWPTSCTRAIHHRSSSRLRIVWYLLRSIFVLRAASARAVASEIGVPLLLPALSSLPPPVLPGALPLALAGEGLPSTWSRGGALWPAKRSPSGALPSSSTFSASGSDEKTLAPLFDPASASISAGSICEYSATRRVRLENSIAFKNAISLRFGLVHRELVERYVELDLVV